MAADLIGHGMRCGFGLILHNEEDLELFVQKALRDVKSSQGVEGVVEDVGRDSHPSRGKDTKLLLSNE